MLVTARERVVDAEEAGKRVAAVCDSCTAVCDSCTAVDCVYSSENPELTDATLHCTVRCEWVGSESTVLSIALSAGRPIEHIS